MTPAEQTELQERFDDADQWAENNRATRKGRKRADAKPAAFGGALLTAEQRMGMRI